MTAWDYAHNVRAKNSFVFASVLDKEARLYLCQPPNTVVLQNFIRAWDRKSRMNTMIMC